MISTTKCPNTLEEALNISIHLIKENSTIPIDSLEVINFMPDYNRVTVYYRNQGNLYNPDRLFSSIDIDMPLKSVQDYNNMLKHSQWFKPSAPIIRIDEKTSEVSHYRDRDNLAIVSEYADKNSNNIAVYLFNPGELNYLEPDNVEMYKEDKRNFYRMVCKTTINASIFIALAVYIIISYIIIQDYFDLADFVLALIRSIHLGEYQTVDEIKKVIIDYLEQNPMGKFVTSR